MPIIKGKTDENSVIFTNGFRTYNGLVNYDNKRHFRVNYDENEFANGGNHINGIKNFLELCKVRLGEYTNKSFICIQKNVNLGIIIAIKSRI
jgi:transposase